MNKFMKIYSEVASHFGDFYPGYKITRGNPYDDAVHLIHGNLEFVLVYRISNISIDTYMDGKELGSWNGVFPADMTIKAAMRLIIDYVLSTKRLINALTKKDI